MQEGEILRRLEEKRDKKGKHIISIAHKPFKMFSACSGEFIGFFKIIVN